MAGNDAERRAKLADELLDRHAKAKTAVDVWKRADPMGIPSEIQLAKRGLEAAERTFAEVEGEVRLARGDTLDPSTGRTLVTPQPLIPPRKRQVAHDEAILEELVRRGYDPANLPPRVPGKRGVKSEIRTTVGKKGIWAGTTVFDKAWDRLRASGQISEGKVK